MGVSRRDKNATSSLHLPTSFKLALMEPSAAVTPAVAQHQLHASSGLSPLVCQGAHTTYPNSFGQIRTLADFRHLVVAASTASAVTHTVIAPLDVIKVSLVCLMWVSCVYCVYELCVLCVRVV